MNRPVPWHILPVIVLAQLMGTSLWFAGNAVLPDLERAWSLREHFGEVVGPLTVSVQLGFILGTLLFAIKGIADRYSPRKVFVLCVVAGAGFNLLAWFIDVATSQPALRYGLLLVSRFMVGFALAGIYPIGMRIASGWYQRGLGTALGWMVGALIIGTAMPHGLRALGAQWPWQDVIITISLFALVGAVLMGLLVPDGPHWVRALEARKFQGNPFKVIFTTPRLRASVLGYWGHMWELYSVFALAPIILATYLSTSITPGVSALVFFVIAVGGIVAAVAGYVAKRHGSAKVATALLACSGLCCLVMPWMMQAPWWLFGLWVFVWGATVSSDSPQFSALTASNAPADQIGTVLLSVNSAGFSISVLSILLSASLWPVIGLNYIGWLLLPGPLLGVWAMRHLLRSAP